VSFTVRGQGYLVLSAVRGILYCPLSGVSCTVRGQGYLVLSAVRGILYCPQSGVSCTVRGQGYLVLSAVRGILYCPRSGYLTTEDESEDTFSLNCTSASNSVTDQSPWRWPSRVETCRSVLRIKIECILVHYLVNIIFLFFLSSLFKRLSHFNILFKCPIKFLHLLCPSSLNLSQVVCLLLALVLQIYSYVRQETELLYSRNTRLCFLDKWMALYRLLFRHTLYLCTLYTLTEHRKLKTFQKGIWNTHIWMIKWHIFYWLDGCSWHLV
jgi:hypothetical protein